MVQDGVQKVVPLNITMAQYQPFRRNFYIKTPSYIPKKAVINIINTNNRRFEWAILSSLFPVRHRQHPDRPTK